MERELGEQATCLTGSVLLRSENVAGGESQAAESSEDVSHVSGWLPSPHAPRRVLANKSLMHFTVKVKEVESFEN